MPYIAVAVDVAVDGTDHPFDYALPPGLPAVGPGQRVLVPLGRRRVDGVVLRLLERPFVDPARVRPVIKILDPEPLLTPELLELAPWLARRCGCTQIQVLRAMLPGGMRNRTTGPRVVERLWPAAPADAAADSTALAGGEADAGPAMAVDPFHRAPAQARAYAMLQRNPGRWTRSELASAAEVTPSVVKALVDRGFALALPEGTQPPLHGSNATVPASASGQMEAAAATEPAAPMPVPDRPVLTPDQRSACEAISAAIYGRRHESFLLHGVTGSGKTEVYLRAIETTLAQGRQAVVLVPEIALTPQTVARFRARFGDRVAVLHSGLTLGQRRAAWRRILRGEVQVAVGARSAVFAPFPHPGLFVVDEEHETSYKQEETPRYHAREVALERARRLGVPVVLGSATPSMESLVVTQQGGGRRLVLPARVGGRPMPEVDVVDMRLERERGNHSLFSDVLTRAVQRALGRGEQVLLFLNRRGFAPVVLCRDCGRTVDCPSCSVTLTFHRQTGLLHCHYCDHRSRPPDQCPHCGSLNVKYFGIGTQRVEELACERFPGARVLRMDVDTTGSRGSHERIYHTFLQGDADILVGTQMVAKGWDIGGVTVVGVVNADTGLHLPDFRAAERTFQLITQVAGRAGRSEKPGRVYVQTYSPEHFAVQAAAAQDCEQFWAREMEIRKSGPWPPYSELVRLVVSGASGERVRQAAEALARALQGGEGSAAEGGPGGCGAADACDGAAAATPSGALPGTRVLGPAAAPIERLRGRFRWHLLYFGPDRDALVAAAQGAIRAVGARDPIRVHLDPSPVSML